MMIEIFKSLRTYVIAVACFASLSMGLSPALLSQTAATGALTGTLKDSSGAVVPNATVTVTNLGTAQVRTTSTDADGTYKFGLLTPGSYKLRFEASGFNAVEVESVNIIVTETSVLDQTVQVGAQTQQVEVRAEAEAVQTATSTVGTVVSSQTMTATPLTTRNYTNLLGLSAGANSGVYNAANLGRGSQDISVNGSGTAQNNMQMDGASITSFNGRGIITDLGSNGGIGVVNPDAIEEFKIQTSLYDAGYGKKPGANVNVVTKSGTNQFHGAAFEFFRNTALNANDFFRKISPAVGGVPANGRQVLNQNQFGGTFGGPVKKDKIFFFTSYQETRQKNGISPAGYSTPTLVGIPLGDRSNTAAFRSALGAAFCTPGGSATIGQGSSVNGPALGGTKVACSGANINPVAINLLQLKNADGSYYIPSSSNGLNQNLTFSLPARFTEHQVIGNFDYVANDKNTLTGRWFYTKAPTDAPMGCAPTATVVSQCLPGGPAFASFPTQNAVLKLTSILTNNVVNEAHVSMQRFVSDLQNLVPFTDTQVGIAPIVPTINYLDLITVSGLFQFGALGNNGSENAVTQIEAADQISWSHGKHTIRAGAEYERDRAKFQLKGVAIGSLTFQSFQDFLLGLPGCPPGNVPCPAGTTGTSTSNISSTGTVTAISAPDGVRHDFRTSNWSAFLQDDFKLKSNLTLNLGVRWEYNGIVYDAGGNFTNVWPSLVRTVPVPGATAATGTLAGFVVPSNYNFAANPAPPVGGVFQNSQKIPTQNSPSLKNFAPRVGFAWKPLSSDRFVVRGGAGYFYDRPALGAYNRMAQAYPYAQTVSASGAATYFSTFSQPYAPTSLGWSPRFVSINGQTGTSSNLVVFAMDPNYLSPVTYEWNLNAQYEFLPTWVLELGYVGTRGIHQIPDGTVQVHQLNSAQLASVAQPINGITTNTVANASVRVPYLGFAPGGIQAAETSGDTKYNSFQVTARKQFSHGLQLQAAYTYSRAFTTTGYFGVNDPSVPLPYGLNPTYRPQRFTINYSYDLPFGKHQGLLDKVASGWNLAGVTVVQGGTPLTINDTRGGSIYGFGSGSVITSTAQFAAGMGSANVGNPGGVEQRLGGATGGPGYFNKAAFGTVPAIGNGTGYGNSAFGIIFGPGQFNFDATLQKTTKVGGIHEDATLVFRAEFFNVFNHAQFSNPTGAQLDVSKSTFGQITSTSVNPRLVQFALKYVF